MIYDKCELEVVFKAAKERHKWLLKNSRIRYGVTLEDHIALQDELVALRGCYHLEHEELVSGVHDQQSLARRVCEANEYVLDQLKLYQRMRHEGRS